MTPSHPKLAATSTATLAVAVALTSLAVAPTEAVAIGVTKTGGVINITANNTASNVRVERGGANITVRNVGTAGTWTFPAAGTSLVKFTGGTANDTFTAQGLDIKIYAAGGGGDDILTGGNSNDMLRGGSGNDTLYGGPGRDTLNGDSHTDTLFGGGDDDTLITIDGVYNDTINDNVGRDSYWYDISGAATKDAVVGRANNDADNAVLNFSNAAADRTLNGDRIPDPAVPQRPADRAAPAGMYYQRELGATLFSDAGPQATDIDQGALNDCKTVSALASTIHNRPSGSNWLIRKAMADFGDGTYGVRLGNKYYRIDDDFLRVAGGDRAHARPAPGNSFWPAIAEKALVTHGTAQGQAPRYWLLLSMSSTVTFDAFGGTTRGTPEIGDYANSATDLGNKLFADYNAYKNVTLSLTPRVATVGGVHAYTLWRVNRDDAGTVTTIVLRNPWATDGNFNGYSDGTDDGIVTMTPAQIWADRVTTPAFGPGRINWGSPINAS